METAATLRWAVVKFNTILQSEIYYILKFYFNTLISINFGIELF